MAQMGHTVLMSDSVDVDRVRDQLRTALRDVNDLIGSIGTAGLPDEIGRAHV